MPKVIQVIQSEVRCGKGIVGNPYRTLIEYYTLDGELLAEYDHWKKTHPLAFTESADEET